MSSPPLPPQLRPLDVSGHTFTAPVKRIQTQEDVPAFKTSPAYKLITSFIVHLNSCVSPLDAVTGQVRNPDDYATNSTSITVSPEVQGICDLLKHLSELIASAPPDPGPRRFGNIAFRKWLALVEKELGTDGGSSATLDQYLPDAVVKPASANNSAKEEALHYLIKSFGSGERLDYGTGHELSFAAFLCCVWVLGGFQAGRDEKALVLRCFDEYFKLIRKLVQTYTLEPAGSHGVWGLDDHTFLPYIFGSAQLTTVRPNNDESSGNEHGVPKPDDVTKLDVVERERSRNLYFDAIGFIYEVKKGPFWEHSPTLYDISGVKKGWAKINEGMLKMYDNEVLGKFPVVQHFPFGSIFQWPAAEDAPQGQSQAPATSNLRKSSSSGGPAAPMQATKAPWAMAGASGPSPTTSKPGNQPLTTAPWAAPPVPPFPTSAGLSSRPPPPGQLSPADTKAPWAHEQAVDTAEVEQTPQATEAALGPRRTSSPDSMLAQKSSRGRAGSVSGTGSGGVRVAETGDLSQLRRPSGTS